jgi:hypothetical protein
LVTKKSMESMVKEGQLVMVFFWGKRAWVRDEKLKWREVRRREGLEDMIELKKENDLFLGEGKIELIHPGPRSNLSFEDLGKNSEWMCLMSMTEKELAEFEGVAMEFIYI